jgi:SM-20-related protein
LVVLELDRLRTAPLCREPFDFVVVEDFLRQDELAPVMADFPQISGCGSYPADALEYGPAFARLLAALTGPELRSVVEEKFGIDLGGRPTMVTVRGRSDGKDGRIHTDSETKIITLLLYLNPVWERAEGRLRLLRGPGNLDDYAREVAPVAGTMLAFRRSGRSFHGHRPHVGERRMLQLNWVKEPAVVRRELNRHRWSARLKALNPFFRSTVAAAAIAAAIPGAAAAQTKIVDEFKFGVLAHDVGLFDKPVEGGADLNFEMLFTPPDILSVIGSPRPHIGGSLNTAGNTNSGYFGLTWGITLIQNLFGWGGPVFLNGSLGGAFQDGYHNDAPPGRKKLGSTALFRESLELGYQLTPTVSVSGFVDHMSNANLAPNNAGITNAGARLGFKF